MNLALLPVPILLPIAGGLLLAIWHPKDRRVRNSLVAVSAVLGGIVIWCFILFAPAESFSLFRLTDSVELRLRLDGAGRLFAGLVASLWPVAAVYSLGYMKETPYLTNFYVFFLFSFGVTIGVAMAGNLVTLYFFFEMLAAFHRAAGDLSEEGFGAQGRPDLSCVFHRRGRFCVHRRGFSDLQRQRPRLRLWRQPP